eukprot:8034272-Lingulodinium_polyedra.AAC.1
MAEIAKVAGRPLRNVGVACAFLKQMAMDSEAKRLSGLAARRFKGASYPDAAFLPELRRRLDG